MSEAGIEAREAVLRARFLAELPLGIAFIEVRIRHMHSGWIGLLVGRLESAMFDAVARGDMERRAREQLDLLIEAARSYRGDYASVRSAYFDRFLATEEAHRHAHHHHPRYPDLRALLDASFRHRTIALAKLLNNSRGSDYDSMVRSVYRSKSEAAGVVAQQFDLSSAVIDLCESERDLLRVPAFLRHDAFRILRETQAWYRARVDDDLSRIYA